MAKPIYKKIQEDGTIIYSLKNGEYHNPHGPAIICPDGSWEYWLNGFQHRENDEPAVYCAIRKRHEWCLNGKLHRDNGPAIVYDNGEERWYHKDRLHRNDGPAITYPNGNIEWYWKDVGCGFRFWLKRCKLSEEEKSYLKIVYA